MMLVQAAELGERPVKSPDDSPIFVIGSGRSGTTLLRQMLNAHPRIHITHEAGFYTYALQTPPRVSASEWLERYFETFSFRWIGVDPQLVRDALPPHLPRERIAEAYRAIMRSKAQSLGKPRYGEKNPLDTQNLGSIFKDFADARVVCIMRDPRPTVASFDRVPFAAGSTLVNSFLCRIQFDHVRPYLDRILEVQLEDLTADPRGVMQKVLRFVGEPWDEAVLDHVNRTAFDDVPPLPWFVGSTREQPNQKTSDGGWRGRMEPAWIRLIERLNRRGMERYGYPLAELAREPRLWDLARALLRDVPGMAQFAYRFLALKRNLYRHFRNQKRLDPQRGMEESININPAAWRFYPEFHMPQVPQLPARSER